MPVLAAKATGAFDVLIVGNVVAIGVLHGRTNAMQQFHWLKNCTAELQIICSLLCCLLCVQAAEN